MKRLALTFFTILAIFGCNATDTIPEPDRDPGDPSLVRLEYHLGRDCASMMNKLEKKYGIIQKKFGTGGRFYNKDHSFTYFYEKDKLIRLVLQVQQPMPRLRPYTGKLPFGLLRRDTYDSVVNKLGTPSGSIMDKNILKYEDKGLTIHFADGTISTVTLEAN